MSLTVNTQQAHELLIDCLRAKLVPMITGSPGCGKSALIHKIADEFNLELIDMRLSQCDPTDLLGFPSIDKKVGKASYVPMNTFPLDTDSKPVGKDGWLLFLDEFNSAPLSVQAAAYKLVLDRKVGQFELNKNVVIACAGNKDTDNAIVNRMSTAMQSRLIHLELEVDFKNWLDWASEADIDYRVRAYINFKPDNLYAFRPDHNDKTFACSRTWEFISKLIKGWDSIAPTKLPLLAGTISEGVAREFSSFCQIFKDLPTVADIARDPTGIRMPDEPSTLYAISGSVGNHCTESNIDKLMQFVERMPIEFQIITLRDVVKRKKDLIQNASVRGWIAKNSQELF